MLLKLYLSDHDISVTFSIEVFLLSVSLTVVFSCILIHQSIIHTESVLEPGTEGNQSTFSQNSCLSTS